jgi:predicted peptidase
VEVHFQPAIVSETKFGKGVREKYTLISPAGFLRQNKYPLIIGMQGYDWMTVGHATYSQAMANSGAYVALTGYHYTHQSEDELLAYTNDVLAVYNQMMKNPNVDTNRVYIFAFSSSTLVVNELIKEYPGRWRGIMLFSPTAQLPEPEENMTMQALITAGSDEDYLWKKYPAYQENLDKVGIPMTWYVHPDSGHIERSQNTMYKKALLMGNMVFNQ